MRQYWRTLSLILPLALLPLTFMTVFAQNAVPGDLLYGYKRGLEGVILASASVHPTTRAMFQSNLADRRFTEVEKVILAKQDTRGLDEFIFSVAEARENIEKVPDQETRLQLRDELVSSIDEYQQKILEIKTIYVTQERVIEREKVVIVGQPTQALPPPTNTPVPLSIARSGEPLQPTNTPVPLPTATPTPTPTQQPLPTNTPVPVPTSRPEQTPRPTNTPVPLLTATPTPTSAPVGGPSALPPDVNIPQKCEHLPTISERLQCAYDEAEKQKKFTKRIQQFSLPQSPTTPTSTPISTVTPIPTCASYTNCQTCISSILRCGWDGGNCRASPQQGCPTGESHWFRSSCNIDECVNITPTSTPIPIPTSTSVSSCLPWDSGRCAEPNQPDCTNYGGPTYCGWNASLWQACQSSCTPTPVPTGAVQGAMDQVSKGLVSQIIEKLLGVDKWGK